MQRRAVGVDFLGMKTRRKWLDGKAGTSDESCNQQGNRLAQHKTPR
jgi:hypothetical protein